MVGRSIAGTVSFFGGYGIWIVYIMASIFNTPINIELLNQLFGNDTGLLSFFNDVNDKVKTLQQLDVYSIPQLSTDILTLNNKCIDYQIIKYNFKPTLQNRAILVKECDAIISPQAPYIKPSHGFGIMSGLRTAASATKAVVVTAYNAGKVIDDIVKNVDARKSLRPYLANYIHSKIASTTTIDDAFYANVIASIVADIRTYNNNILLPFGHQANETVHKKALVYGLFEILTGAHVVISRARIDHKNHPGCNGYTVKSAATSVGRATGLWGRAGQRRKKRTRKHHRKR